MVVKKNINKNDLSMPIATAVWLVDNTALTFEQIALFCNLSVMEVNAIANGTIANNVLPVSPIGSFLSKEEIERCQADETATLNRMEDVLAGLPVAVQKTKQYKSLAQRRARLDAALWLVSFAGLLSNSQIAKITNSTTKTVEAIRAKTYRYMDELVPKDPVILDLCSKKELMKQIELAEKRRATDSDQTSGTEVIDAE